MAPGFGGHFTRKIITTDIGKTPMSFAFIEIPSTTLTFLLKPIKDHHVGARALPAVSPGYEFKHETVGKIHSHHH